MKSIQLQFLNDNKEWVQIKIYRSVQEFEVFEADLGESVSGMLSVDGKIKIRLVMVIGELHEVLCTMSVWFKVPFGEMSHVIKNFFKGEPSQNAP